MIETLHLRNMGALQKIGQGGQGVVYKAPNVKTIFSRRMVFKEYKKAALASLNVDALKAMPEFLENLPYRDGAHLIDIAAWPCRVVQDGARVIGFVMPSIPDDFFTDITTARGNSRVVAEFQHLLNPPQVLAMRFGQKTLTERQKYELLRRVASALSFLHERGVCVGDMSPKNMLFSLNGSPSIYFIDCDAMRVKGVSLTQQLETPGWAVPTGEERATVYSDRYKLGLLTLRLILGDQDVKDPLRLPKSVPDVLRDVIAKTLNRSPEARPTLSEWDLALDRARALAPIQPATVPIPVAVSPVHPHPSAQPTRNTGQSTAPQPQARLAAQTGHPSAPYHTAPSSAGTPGPNASSRNFLWGIAAAFLIIGLISAVIAVGSSDTTSKTATRSTPGSTTTASPPAAQTTSRRSTPTPAQNSPRAVDPNQFIATRGVTGLDPNRETCDGWRLNDRSGWATHSVRGSEKTSCQLADNVLTAYWGRYPEPSLARRQLEVPGSLLCRDVPGALCSADGRLFVMTCVGERGSDGDWITCTGGVGARVYIF